METSDWIHVFNYKYYRYRMTIKPIKYKNRIQ